MTTTREAGVNGAYDADRDGDAAVLDAGSGCLDGGACVPSQCELGALSCSASGVPTCGITTKIQDVTSCDAGAGAAAAVCHGGACGACSSGSDCTEAGSCLELIVVCSSGSAVCTGNGFVTDGKSCGNNLFTNRRLRCMYGGSELRAGGQAVQSGVGLVLAGTGVVCTDQMTAAMNGTYCGANQVCNNGQCSACTANLVCTRRQATAHTQE